MTGHRAGIAVVLLAAGACSPPQKAPAPPEAASSVLFITVDTLRADYVGATREGTKLTPALDGLAGDGVSFTDDVTNCTVTRCSHASMLTGLYPWRHGISGQHEPLPAGALTVAERLGPGIVKGAIVSSLALRHFGRGFDTYQKAYDGAEPNRQGQKTASAEATARTAVNWLREHRGDRFFLFVHFLPPHGPYRPPAAFRIPGLARASGERLPVSADNYERGAIPAYQRVEDERDPAQYRARYAENVRYADHYVGELLDELRALGRYERTAVVVTSDHGESLGEHDWYFCHGNLTYREQSAVPLIVKLPGSARGGQRVSAPVQGVDVAPTLLELLGQRPPPDLDGRSVLATLDHPPDADRARFIQSYGGEELSVLKGHWKLSRHAEPRRWVEPGHPARELYRLDADPAESRNLVDESPAALAALQKLLDPHEAAAPVAPLDGEAEEQLRAMGYVR